MSGRAIDARAAPFGARALARVDVVPIWAWLTLLVLVSTGVRFALAYENPGPWIFVDEVGYWNLATSLGQTGSFAIRDVAGDGGFGPVYPALISPAPAIFDDPVRAYVAAKGINALLMSLAAIPVYFLARRLAGQALSLLAAALAVAIPGMVYTAGIMTENAFYPVIATFALALVLALEKPTAIRQIAVFAVLALAFYTRAQAAILVLVVLSAIAIVVLVEAIRGRFGLRAIGRSLGAYAVTWLILLGAALVLVVLNLARGTAPRELLGAYGGVSEWDFSAGPVARWFLYHLADLDLAVGFLPFGAFLLILLLAFRDRTATRSLLVFAAVGLALVFWFTLTVSAYATDPGANRIEERNLFHVVPVLLVALVVWVQRGLPRPLWAAAPAIAAMCALPGVIPYEAFLNGTTGHSTFALAPLWWFSQRYSVALGDVTVAVVLGALAAGILFALLPRRFALVAPALVLVYLALATSPLETITTKAARDELNAGIQVRKDGPVAQVDRLWVDRAVGADADVVWLWWSWEFPWSLFEIEFFNKSVGRLYNIDGPRDGLPQETLEANREGILLDQAGKPVTASHVLAPYPLTLEGEVVATDDVIGTKLYRVDGPLRLIEQVDGVYVDRWAAPEVAYTRYGCSGGTLVAHLKGYGALHPRPQTVTASIDERVVARTVVPVDAQHVPFGVPLEADANGRCSVEFLVTPTAIPANVIESTDTRRLGVLFVSFEYLPGE